MIGASRTPYLFTLAGIRGRGMQLLGVGPFAGGLTPLPQVRMTISGVTRDSAGATLAACTVTLYRTVDNVMVDSVTSDANGAYAFGSASASFTYYIVAYLAGSPDVAGTTVNTLTAV
jgi:hypothetical protein